MKQRLSTVSPPLIILALFIASVVTFYRPIVDADMYLGVATGNLVLQTHAIPATEVFSWSAQGRSYIPYEWLSQTWIAWLYTMGSLPLVSWYVASLYVLCLFLLYRLARILDHSLWVSVAGSAATGLLLYEFFTPRPYIVGIFLFLVVLLSLLSHIAYPAKAVTLSTWLWTIPLTYLWSNMHPSFLFAPYLFFSYAGVMLLARRITGQQNKLPGVLALTGLGQVLATFLPPFSLRPYQLFWQIISDFPFIQTLYDEWKPLVSNPYYMGLYLSLLIAFFSLALLVGRGKTRLTHLLYVLPLVPFIIAPFESLRHLPWGIIALYTSAVILIPSYHILHRHIRTLLILITCLSLILTYGKKISLLNANWHLPQTALSFLRDHHLNGRMLNDMPIGGYLAAELYPTYQTFFDGRAEVFACCELRDFYALTTLKNAPVDTFKAAMYTLIEKYHFSYLLVPTSTYNPLEFSTISLIADLLTDDPQWRLIYVSDYMRIIVKNDRQNDALFETYGTKAITPYRLTQYKTGKEKEALLEYERMINLKDSGIAESGLGQVNLALGELDSAETAFQQATTLNPRIGRPYLGLAKIALARNQPTVAQKYLIQSLRVSPYLGESYLLLATIYEQNRTPNLAKSTLISALGEDIDLISRQKIIQKLAVYDKEGYAGNK